MAEKDVTVYRIIDQPDAEQRKMAYVLSMRDEIVSLLSYMVGCMLGRYSARMWTGCCTPGANGSYDAVCARIAQGARGVRFLRSRAGAIFARSRRHCARNGRRLPAPTTL